MFSFSLIDMILFILFVGTAYWFLTRTYGYWKERNVVHDKPYPLIGSFGLRIIKENISVVLQHTYNKYPNEKMVGGFLSKKPVLILRDPDLIKQVFVKDFNHFRDRGFNFNSEREPLTQHLFISSGDTWKTLRQKLTPTFTSGKMRNAFPILAECGKEFQNYLNYVSKEGVELETKELMAKYTTDVIGSYAFGIKMNSMKDENAPFRIMGRTIFERSYKRVLKMALFRFSPFLFDLFKIRITSMELQDFFIGLFKSVVANRDNKPSARNDFVDLLIELKSKGYVKSDRGLQDEPNNDSSVSIKMTDELLAAQAFIFFAAGFETSSTTMTFALYELAKNKAIQDKLFEEINRVLLKYNGQVTDDTLKEMNYLRMVINETLRKYPPVGTLIRECTTPYEFPDSKVKLDKGIIVQIPVYAIQHDPQYYPEPEKFIPERFSAEEVANRHPFVFLPFGEGPRNCIGERFGRIQTMMGLIYLLELYSVEPYSKTVPEIKIAVASNVLASDKEIYLKLKQRKMTNSRVE